MATQNQQKAEIEYLQQEIAKMEKQLGPDSTASFAERLAAGAQLPQLREELEAVRAGRSTDPQSSERRGLPLEKFSRMPSTAQAARNVGKGALEIDAGPESDEQTRQKAAPRSKKGGKSVLRGERSLADYFGLPDNEQFDRFMNSVISTVLAGYEPAKAKRTRKQAEGADLSGDQVQTFLENLVKTQVTALGDTEYEAFRSPDAPQEPPIGDTSRSSDVDDLDESAGSRPLSPLMGGALSGDVGAVATAPAAPKKQTAPATKAARTDDKDAPAEDMAGIRQSISDVRPISRPSMETQMRGILEDPGQTSFPEQTTPDDPMELEAAAGQTFRTQREMDEEIAAREPLGESAGRLAIQDFMERNFGFRPTVTYDDDSDPDLNP